ncbi:uncharacterized protein J3R85_003423 [Psidium guajava]|nr:uncharacterized protein J3R85_003423 [Psidium guajava]
MHQSKMDDSQRLMGLKKAYAEIILGMAKEEAARVMAAEKRASQFREELLGSKEEAMRLLLRLKQMYDAKLSEAETTSAWQQKRIVELEAHLQESKSTVKELREELKEARDQLENETTHKSHQVSKAGTTGDTVKPKGKRHTTSGSIRQSQSDSQTAYEVSGMNISSFSITVTRGKEPKLRRNKDTQRVWPFEKNSSAQVSFSGQKENVEHGTYSGGTEGKVSAAISNLSADKKKRKRTPGCRSKNTSWGKLHDRTLTKQQASDVFSFGISKESHPQCRLHSPMEATEVTEKSGALVTRKDVSKIMRQGNGGVQYLNVLATRSDPDKINDLSNSDLKASGVSDRISGRPLENNIIKFTFTRRKKETSCSPDGSFCGADITSEKKKRKHDHSLNQDNSALSCETSQDSQQLVQIAEQLISLKNKWQ